MKETILLMQKSFGAVASAAFALLAVQTAQAQDVKAIVAKTNAVYHNLKSLKVSLQTTGMLSMGAREMRRHSRPKNAQ